MGVQRRKPRLPFTVLIPKESGDVPSTPAEGLVVEASPEQLLSVLHSTHATGLPLAFDIETRGNEAHKEDSYVVGFGLATASWAGYWSAEHWPTFLKEASRLQVPLLAHNAVFDLAYAKRDMDRLGISGQLRLAYCTYFTYKYLATEGWLNQRWGLKGAQTDLLGWEETNEIELDRWLVENGYHTSPKTSESFERVKEKHRWFWDASSLRYVKPDKSQMWRAPASILGHYCALDSYATARLYFDVLRPALDRFVALDQWLTEYGPFLIDQCILQQLRGFVVDRDRLQDYLVRREAELRELERAFLERDDVKPFVVFRWERLLKEMDSKEPARYLKQKWPKEPARHRKDGTESLAWRNWYERTEAMKAEGPIESKNWQNWKEKRDSLTVQDAFNIGSGKQLQELLYDYLQYPVNEYTDSGEPAVSGNALLQMGDIGLALDKINEVAKELTYVRKALEVSAEDGLVHPQFRVPGTLTGRLAGSGGLSLHQQPKTRGYLECFVARPGMAWVDTDATALEPHVLAEASRDKALLGLYAPGRPANDVYMYVAAQIEALGKPFLDMGYDPENPDKEVIGKCKKALKKQRGIAKVVHLASSYGAGPKKIQAGLKLQGIDLSFAEVKQIHADYWKLFDGVKRYEKFLLDQWEANRGWVLNPIGRPIGVDAEKTKDLVNRCIQSGGHDIMVMYIKRLYDRLRREGVEFYPIIADFHDETIIECGQADVDKVQQLMKEEWHNLNKELGGYILIRGEPEVGTNLAKFKCEE